jgi:gliding motility-associatede transport system auxiliary component
MATSPKPQRSFSPGGRWKIAFDVAVRTVLVLAVVVMVNYLGNLFAKRFYLSSATRIRLSQRTVDVLRSMTNRVEVTLYYDTGDDFYPTIRSLLKAYSDINSDISVRTVDYERDPGEAEKIKAKYNLTLPTDKNLIIFDCAGRAKVLNGDALVQYAATGKIKDHKMEFSAVAFNGEEAFTAMLIAVTSPKPFMAYFLQGDGEPPFDPPAGSGLGGYLKFVNILGQNYIRVEPLELSGNSPVPTNCNLIIIAGPTTAFSNLELQKIEQYLSQGGRLFVLLNFRSIHTGLEDLLRQWGVNVGNGVVQDPDNSSTPAEQDVLVRKFSGNPVVNPLTGAFLQLIMPRPVSSTHSADAPKVEELAFSGPESTLSDEHGLSRRSYPLMAAVEQNEIKGIGAAHSGARMIVVGDSFFLDNEIIAAGANRDFAGYAVNWLLARPALLKGIGPQPVAEFRLLMTKAQLSQVRWLLLAALPGTVLALGGLVWLRRRK